MLSLAPSFDLHLDLDNLSLSRSLSPPTAPPSRFRSHISPSLSLLLRCLIRLVTISLFWFPTPPSILILHRNINPNINCKIWGRATSESENRAGQTTFGANSSAISAKLVDLSKLRFLPWLLSLPLPPHRMMGLVEPSHHLVSQNDAFSSEAIFFTWIQIRIFYTSLGYLYISPSSHG